MRLKGKKNNSPFLWQQAQAVVKLADLTNHLAGPQNKITSVFPLGSNCSLLLLLGTTRLLKPSGLQQNSKPQDCLDWQPQLGISKRSLVISHAQIN